MTQAERTRAIKYVLAESGRWLLHRRRDTKKINISGCRKKIRKGKTKSRKQGTKACKEEHRTQGVSIAINLPVSATKPRRGPCHTICHLLPSAIYYSTNTRYNLRYDNVHLLLMTGPN